MPSIAYLLAPVIAFGFVSYLLSRALTGASIGIAQKIEAVAHPNHRSSHEEPTPRIGGIGPVGACLILIPVLVFGFVAIQNRIGLTPPDEIPFLYGIGLCSAVLIASVLGFVDDLGKLGTAGKFIGQAIVGIIPIACGLSINYFEFPFLGAFELPTFVGWILAWCWIVLMMNVVNFMDGINGLAGRFMEVFGLALIVITINTGWRYEIVWLGAIIMGSALGFLPFNLGQAKTFMGDCGSQALGALFACSILLMHNNDLKPLEGVVYFDSMITGLILCFPLIFDVIFTVIKRMMKGENILRAHRQHLYQRYLIANGEDHHRTLSFVSNFFYLAGICAIVYNRCNLGYDGFRLLVIILVIAAMIYQVMRVQKHETISGIPAP